MKYFVEAGSTNPQMRFTAISTKPAASKPRRGRIRAQTSGRAFQVFLRFSFLLTAESLSLAMSEWSQSVWMPRAVTKLYTTALAIRLGNMLEVRNPEEFT